MNATDIVEKTTQTNLVIVKNETPVVSHLVISENTGNDKNSISRLIKNYTEQLEEFGRVGFEIIPLKTNGGVQDVKQYFLNENQATFLMTLLKNNEVVVNFKLNLVKAFSKMRETPRKITTEDIINHIKYLDLANKMLLEGIQGAKTMINEQVQENLENAKFAKKIIEQQNQEIKQLKAENNKHKTLQTSISQLGQAKVLMSVEEAGVKLNIYRNTLYLKMRNEKFLKKDNAPYKFYEGEYFVQKKVKYKNMQTFITPKGFELLKTTFI